MNKSKRAESSAESTPKMDASSKERTDHLADREGRPIKVADAPAIQAHVRVPEAVDKGKWLKRQSSRRRSSVSALSRRDSEDHGSRGDSAASYRKSSSPRPDRRPRLSVSPPPRQLKGSVDSTTSPIATEASVASTSRPSFMSTSPGRQQQQQQEKEGGRGRAAPRAATDVSDSRGRRLGSAASGRSTEEARPLAGTHPSSSSSSSSSSRSPPPLLSSSSSPALRCSVCRANFTAFLRPHRCRKCGETVCATCSPARTPKRTCKRCVGDSEEPLVLAVASPHPPAVAVPFPTTVQATGLAMAARRTEGSGDSASKVELTSKTVTVVAPAASVSQAAVTGAAAGAAAAAAASGAGPPTLTCSFDHAEHMKKEGEERASSIAQGARSDVEGEIPEVAEDGEVADDGYAEDDERMLPEPAGESVGVEGDSSEDVKDGEAATLPQTLPQGGEMREAAEADSATDGGIGEAVEGALTAADEGTSTDEAQEEKPSTSKRSDSEPATASHDGVPHTNEEEEEKREEKEEEEEGEERGASGSVEDADEVAGKGAAGGAKTIMPEASSSGKEGESRGQQKEAVEEVGSTIVGGEVIDDGYAEDDERMLPDPVGDSVGVEGESGEETKGTLAVDSPPILQVPQRGGRTGASPAVEEGAGEGAEGVDREGLDVAVAAADEGAGTDEAHGDKPSTSNSSNSTVASGGPQDEALHKKEEEEREAEREVDEELEDGVDGNAEDAAASESTSSPQVAPPSQEEQDRGQTQHAVEEARRVGGVEGAVDGGYEEDDERMLPDTAATTVEGGSKEAVEEPEDVGLPPVVPAGGEKGEAAEESAGGAAEGFDHERLDGVLAAATAAASGTDDPVDDAHEQRDAPVATAGLKEKEMEKEEEDKVAKQEMVEKDAHVSALIENTDEAEDLDGGNVIADAPESETMSSPRVPPPSIGEEDKGQAEHALEEAGSTRGVGGAVDGGCEEDDERILPEAGGGSVDVEGESGDEAKDGEVAGVPQTAIPPDDEEMEGAADDSAGGKGACEAAEGFDHAGLDGALATPGGAGAGDPVDDEPPTHEGSVALVAAGGEEGEEKQKEEEEEEEEKAKEDKEEEDQGKKGQEKEPVEGGDASKLVESTDGTVLPSSRKEEDRGQAQHAVEEAARVGGAEEVSDKGYEEDDERMLPHSTGTTVEGGGREEANKHEDADSLPVVPAGGKKGIGEAAESDPVAEEAAGEAAEGFDREGLDGVLAAAAAAAAGGTGVEDDLDAETAKEERKDLSSVVATIPNHDEEGQHKDGEEEEEEEEREEDTGTKREDRREGDGSSTAGVETIVERGMGRQKEEQGILKSPPVFRDSQVGGGGSEKEQVEEEGPGEARQEKEEVVVGTQNIPGGSYDDVPEMTQLEAMKAPAFGLPGGEQGDAVVMKEEEKGHKVVMEEVGGKEAEEERVVDGGEQEEEQGHDEVGVVVEREQGEVTEGSLVEVEQGGDQEEEAVAQQKEKEKEHAAVMFEEMKADGEKSKEQQEIPAPEHDGQPGDEQVGDGEVVDSPVEAAVASQERDPQQEDHQRPSAPSSTAIAGESGSSSGAAHVKADDDGKGGAATTCVPTVVPKTASGTEKVSVEKVVVSVPPTGGEGGSERAGGGREHLSDDGSSSLLETIKEMIKKGRSCCP